MVSCDPYQTYKIPLKTNEQSVIEHNLVTIYLNLEWPDNNQDNPNLLLHIFDKKTSPKTYKNDSSMSYFQQNQSSLFVNSIHQQQNFGSTYQQQYFHHSSVVNNEPPTTTTTITTGDHNDVSSTTTTVVFSALQPPLAPPPPPPPSTSSPSHMPIQQIKTDAKTQLSPRYRRQQSMSSPPICSSTNQQYLSAQHVIQTPSTNMDTQSNLQMSPTIKTISPTSTNAIPTTKQTMTHMIDLQQSSPVSSYPTTASTFKTYACNCLKPHTLHEQNCPTLALVKQSNPTLTPQTIVCRPPINRTIAQRAAAASQNRTVRSISMTPVKDQGQIATTLIPYPLTNLKSESIPNITTIVSEQQPNVSTVKKPIVRQRSTGSTSNARQRRKRLIKQISVPNGTNSDQSIFFNQINLNDPKSQPSTSPVNPTIKLVSPFSLQTTVSNSEIDQTIDDVINGKGEIPLNDSTQTKTQLPQPSSQLVWVQNGTVTTKTWLSPLYQKQQNQTTTQSTYDPLGSTLTHQDVVNIAQQVIFPTNTEPNQMNSVLETTNISKKKARSKPIHNTPLKRTRKPSLNNRSQLKSTVPSSQSDLSTKPPLIPSNQSPITPICNLINKPITWPNNNNTTTTTNNNNNNSTSLSGSVTTTNPSQLSSFDKNDSWQSHCIENVDSMLDEFHLASIDEQRMNSTNHFDFDLSIDGFSSKTNDRFTSSTPPPLLTIDNQRYSLLSNEKPPHTNSTTLMNNSRLSTGDVDVYDHFLNPYSSSTWQENQVSSSVSTPPDFHLNHLSSQQYSQMQIQQSSQQYYPPPPPSSSQLTDEHFDQYHSQSQTRLLFNVQS